MLALPRARLSHVLIIAVTFNAVLYVFHPGEDKSRAGSDVACCAATALSMATAGCYTVTGFFAVLSAGAFTPAMGACVAGQAIECGVGAAMCDQTGKVLTG